MDRSTQQTERTAVVFSDAYDNLLNYTYSTDAMEYTNFAYAFGQGTGKDRKQATYYTGKAEPQRLDRYEVYVDANDISDTENAGGTEVTIPEDEYKAVGDYVTVQNARFGLTLDKIQLIGMIESFDKDGYSLTPVMQTLEG